ncbi:MAG: hypothetical protein M1831_004404 [Alyxoria varia]|nr:MAG: hypothetical protein M1831_004404 [Alyxoria varia]
MVTKSVQDARDDLRRDLSQYICMLEITGLPRTVRAHDIAGKMTGLRVSPKDVRIRPKEDDRYMWRPLWNQPVFKQGQNISDMPARDCRKLQRQLGNAFTVQKISFEYERHTNPWDYQVLFSITTALGTYSLPDSHQWLPHTLECPICGHNVTFDASGTQLCSVVQSNKQQLGWTKVLTVDNFEVASLEIESQQMLECLNETLKGDDVSFSHSGLDNDMFKTESPSSPGVLAELEPERTLGWTGIPWEGSGFDHANEFWSPAPFLT